jgi:hypothetical protein
VSKISFEFLVDCSVSWSESPHRLPVGKPAWGGRSALCQKIRGVPICFSRELLGFHSRASLHTTLRRIHSRRQSSSLVRTFDAAKISKKKVVCMLLSS